MGRRVEEAGMISGGWKRERQRGCLGARLQGWVCVEMLVQLQFQKFSDLRIETRPSLLFSARSCDGEAVCAYVASENAPGELNYELHTFFKDFTQLCL